MRVGSPPSIRENPNPMRMTRLPFRFAFAALVFPVALGVLAAVTPADVANAAPRPPPTLDDYRHFRAVAIDLLGRMPTREEVAEFEKPSFSLDAWVDGHLQGGTYAERLS